MGLDTLIVTIVVAALGYTPFAVLRFYDRIVSSSRETVGLVNDLLDLSERLRKRSGPEESEDDSSAEINSGGARSSGH